jgi:hypothetical protein
MSFSDALRIFIIPSFYNNIEPVFIFPNASLTYAKIR